MSCNCGCQGSEVAIGALERRNPLPPGRYWIDVIDTPHQVEFSAWSFGNQATVRILRTEHFEALRWPDCPVTEGECWPSRDWVLFDVSADTPWMPTLLGFPNIVRPGENIQTSADTADIGEAFDDTCDIACQAKWVAVAAGVLFGGLTLYTVVKR